MTRQRTIPKNPASNRSRIVLFLILILGLSPDSRRPALPASSIEKPEKEAQLLIKSGSAEEGLRKIEAVAREHEAKKDWEQAWAAYRVATLISESVGNYQKMITYAAKNLEITREHLSEEKPRAHRQSLQLLARAYLAVNDPEKALSLVREALPRRIPKNPHGQQAYANLRGVSGDIYRTRGNWKAAVKEHEEALRVQEGVLTQALAERKKKRPQYLVPRAGYLRHLTALARDFLGLGDYENALIQAQMLLRKANEFGFRDWEAEGNRLLGDIALKKGDDASALSHYQKALSAVEKLPMPGVSLWSHVGSARAYLKQGKPDRAIGHLERAMDAVEEMRSALQSEDLRSSFFEDKTNIYSDAVLTQLQLNKAAEAFRTMERSRSRAFLDLLGTKVSLSKSQELIAAEMELRWRLAEVRLAAEVEEMEEELAERLKLPKAMAADRAYNEFLAEVRKQSKEQASLMTVEPLGLIEVQGLLEPKQTLIEYFVTSERTLLWVVEKDKITTLSIPISHKELTSELNYLRKAVAEKLPIGDYQRVARVLYRILIEPALAHIRGSELILVPHDVLHYLPFQALYSSQGRYLIEDYSLSYLSSASLLQFTTAKRKAERERVLALANPDLGDSGMNLRFAGLEADEVKKVYPQSTALLLGKEASEEKVKRFSQQFEILHFAVPVELKETDPLSSAVLLAREGNEDGRLEMREVFRLQLDNADLVVLSGCETGLGKLSDGDEFVGLTRAFIYAGTPSVMASLWKVEDSSTAALMASFYKNLRTMTKVEALRQAQLELITGKASSDLLARRGVGGIGKLGEVPQAKPASPGPVSISTSHPYFWAPFILVGDGK